VVAAIFVELTSLDALVMLDDLMLVVALGMIPAWSQFGAAMTGLCHRAAMDVARVLQQVFGFSPSLLSPILLLLALFTGLNQLSPF
jgi:hypothetical protein